MNPIERILRRGDRFAGVLNIVSLLRGAVDGNNTFVASRECLADADLGLGFGPELFDDVTAAADDAADLANGAEVAVDGVVGADVGLLVVAARVPAFVPVTAAVVVVGVGLGVGAFAVRTALTGHRLQFG